MGIFTDKIKTAIEIYETEIKVVQLTAEKSEIRIIACLSEEIPSGDIKSAADKLRQILKKINLKSKDVILIIPRQCATTKIIDLPSQDPAEIEEMAGFQTIKQIPYPKDEVVFGVNLIETTAEGYSKVMLVICHREMVERPVAILKNCGLVPSKATLSSFGTLNWLMLERDLTEATEAAPVIVIDCDRENTDIVIAYRKRMIYTRGLTFGSNEGERYLEKLNEEILRTFSTFEKEFSALKPKLIIFTGNVSNLPAGIETVKWTAGIKTEFVDTFRPFPSGAPEGFKSSSIKHSFSSVIGAAAGPDQVNLLPGKMKMAYSARSRREEILVSASLVAAVAVLISLAALNKIRQKEESLKLLEKRLENLAPSGQEIAKMRAVADVIRSESGERSLPLAVLTELYRITPPSISLTLYQYEEGKINIKGTASALSEVFGFVKVLDDSRYFRDVEVKYAAKRKTEDTESVDFEMVCPLSVKTETNR